MSRWRNEPIDAVLQQAPVRIMRALRWCGWIDAYDFRDVVLDCSHEDAKSKGAIATAMKRLTKDGLIERRSSTARIWGYSGGDRYCYEVRITPKGREWLAEKLKPDTSMEFAPAREGSEHLLCDWEDAA